MAGAAVKAVACLITLLKYFSFFNILNLLAYAAFFAIVLMKVMPNLQLDKYIKEDLKQYIVYLPAAVILLANLILFIDSIKWITFISVLSFLAETAAILFTTAFILLTDFEATERQHKAAAANANAAPVSAEDGFYDLAMHVILLLVTCGIWQYIWIYKVTKYLNGCPGEEYRNPTNKLLLCMFVPFYYIFWTYKSAQRIDKMAAAKGIPSDIATICLIVSFFVSIVAPILMQSKINSIATNAVPNNAQYTFGQNTAQYNAAPDTAAEPAKPSVDAAEEIRKFKELLDCGAITQEEYDAKKKQLLDI